MSLGTSVTFDDAELRKYLSRVDKRSPKIMKESVRKTTLQTLREMKEKFLPKRTGTLRKSYLSKKIDDLTFDIFAESTLKYANAIELGGPARTIYPHPPKKFLTIPLNDSVLTKTRSQIKKSALDKLFKRLKEAKGNAERYGVMQSVGIILAKKANLGATKAQYNIRDKAKPFAEKLLVETTKKGFREMGFE